MKCVYSPGIELEFPEKTRLGWKTVSLVSIDGNGFDPTRSGGKPIRILLTATGLMQNTDMQLEERSGNNITFGNRWGKEPVLCEGIPMKVEFLNNAKSVKCYALDESGNRREEVPVDGNKIALKPEYKTLWYEITLH